MVAEGYSYKHICDYLNSNGFRHADGRCFKAHFYDILRNRKYIGEYVYNSSAAKNSEGKYNRHKYKPESEIIRIPNGIPRLVSDELFLKVQAILDERKDKPKNTHRENTDYLLSGLLNCGVCGQAICGGATISHKKRYKEYRCNGTKQHCPTKAIIAEYLDEYIIKLFTKCLLVSGNIEKLVDLIKVCYIAAHDKFNAEIDKTNQQIEQANSKIQEIAREIAGEADSSISKYLSQEILEMQLRVERLNDSLNRLIEAKTHFPPFNPKVIKQRALTYYNTLKSDGFKEQRILLNNLVNVISIDNTSVKVKINFHPFLDSPIPIHCTVIECRDNIGIQNRHNMQVFEFSRLTVSV